MSYWASEELRGLVFIAPVSNSEDTSPLSSPVSCLGQWSQPLVLVTSPWSVKVEAELLLGASKLCKGERRWSG